MISYGSDDFYMMDVEQSNILNIDQVTYQLKEIKATESFGNTDFNFRERYYIKLKLSHDGKTMNYSCDDKDNPWPYRTYIKL